MQCGPIRFRVTDKEQIEERDFDHVVYERHTNFAFQNGIEDLRIQEIYAELVANEERNKVIVKDLCDSVDAGRTPLLLTERVKHLDYFEEQLKDLSFETIILRGGMGKKKRRQAMEAISNSSADKKRVILSTGRYIGEGFDDPRLDTLFLAMPISWTGTLQQYVGRLHRLHHGKKIVQVYDYVDSKVPTLRRMFNRRANGYKSIGYRFADLDAPELF